MTEIGTRTVWGRRGGGATSADGGLLVLALGATLCAYPASALDAATPPGEDSASVLALAREAANAAQTSFRTGRIEGSFRMWGSDKKLMQSARFTGAFDGSQHYLKLTYTPTGHPSMSLELDKRILVCDGSELFVSRFSERIHPVGAEADVFESGPVYRHHAAHGFPGIPKKLVSGILSPETLEKYAVEMEQLANGHFRGRYRRRSDYHSAFEIAPEYGYHCVLFESFSGTELVNRWTVAWERTEDLWYISGCKTERYKDGKHSETNEWQLDEFEANVPVSPELFTLNALELPGRARIIDRRLPEGPLVTDSGKPIPREAKIYRVPGTEGEVERKKADRLVEQVEAMPLMYQTEQVESAWGLRIWGIAIGFLGIAAIAIVWFIQMRKAA